MPVKHPIEDAYLDVLQNIEFAIVSVYRNDPELTNWDVESAIDALIRQYQAEWRGKPVRPAKLSTPRKREVYEAVKSMCELRLGRDSLETESGQTVSLQMESLSLEEIVAILKRIRKSVRFWDKREGRRGYLDYISAYF